MLSTLEPPTGHRLPIPDDLAVARNATSPPSPIAGRAGRGAPRLRIATAGSVDDGKSTLIGRLLHDSKSLMDDQLSGLSRRHGGQPGELDLSLLTDGLKAEREQGITIDVAYRYFSTPRRHFILADTPGHEQYTRNMATGASTADVAIILVDARHGLLPQTRRHSCIAALLGIRHFVLAVNKMDLVAYDEARFRAITAAFAALNVRLGGVTVQAIPLSALRGDNVVERSAHLPWYQGPTLIRHLEDLDVAAPAPAGGDLAPLGARFPVQAVLRPHQDFRGFAGTLAAGELAVGAEVLVLPRGMRTRIKGISTFDGPLLRARTAQSIVVTTTDEIDISRGEMIVSATRPPRVADRFDATLVWLAATPLDPAKRYDLKHTTRTTKALVSAVRHRVDVVPLGTEPATTLRLNEIGSVELETTQPLFIDAYERCRTTGSFILIDPLTNDTVAAGMVAAAADAHADGPRAGGGEDLDAVQLRRRVFRQAGTAVWLDPAQPGGRALATAAERALVAAGCFAITVSGGSLPEDADPALFLSRVHSLVAAGVVVLLWGAGRPEVAPAALRLAGINSLELSIYPHNPDALGATEQAAAALVRALGPPGVFPTRL